MQGEIVKISGPLVVASKMSDCKLYETVSVGNVGLVGEIIELRGENASIQVYEDTEGLFIGEPVQKLDHALSIELAPGLLGNVFDGIGRPLNNLYKIQGDRIGKGEHLDTISRLKKWDFIAQKQIDDCVEAGDILGIVKETDIIENKILVPYGISGKIKNIASGKFSVTDCVAIIETDNNNVEIMMLNIQPVRRGRPFIKKLPVKEPLVTGQRVIDTLFPIAKGGVAAIPGPFGSGKTVVQHQLAKWSDADVVVYIGCGERGNEITDVINEFSELKDPKTGKLLMQRTVLIANTSDMPVAAREASIYTGISIAEYYRDMGYNVVIMADSTSRWAEALREMSGRLEEMPGEEGYPAYLGSRLADFYERAGFVQVLGSDSRYGSISAIGAVSPQGGDLSEPVSQATLRIVKVFWGLSSNLAYKRHYPAIDWLVSYSQYSNKLVGWYKNNLSEDYMQLKNFALKILQQESELNEIVQLVGFDVLSSKDKLTMEVASSVREDFLQQDAFGEIDTYTSLAKQNKMLKLIYDYYNLSSVALDNGATYPEIIGLSVRSEIGRMKYIKENDLAQFDAIEQKLIKEMSELKG